MQRKTRRHFIETSLKAGITLPFLGTTLSSCDAEISNPAKTTTQEKEEKKPLSILILGGTSFLGPHQIAYALERGHSVTTFTRGKTKPTIHQAVFKNVESLIGDREDNLEALKGRKWDAVIDNSGRKLKWTEATAELLKDHVGLYVYTSSTGVFYPYLGSDFKETDEVLLEEPTEIEDEDTKLEYWYGVMKATSELAAQKAFGKDRTIVVRPTYMFGPGDKTDRFVHWPVRLSRGGEVLVPGKKEDAVQYIDVRDVAEWMIRLVEEKNTQTFNAVGPANPTGIYDFVKEAQTAFDVESQLIAVTDYELLKENGIHYIVPWIMPEGNNRGSALINNDRAKANGLTYRPLKQSIKDTYDWWYSDALTDERRKKFEEKEGSALLKEKELLEQWKSRVVTG
ncbi:MAG: NAD-dependent epimerase/dehydratase family protein [Bacteroidota bacterium]